METIKIAPCSYKAAKYAVEHWHYSKCLPAGRFIKYGVWENNKFIGVIIYSRGNNKNIGSQYCLSMIEVVELTRVALDAHMVEVSHLIAETLKRLKKTNSGLRLVISCADPREGHRGGIYQAGNWLYVGTTVPSPKYLFKGKELTNRTIWGTISRLKTSPSLKNKTGLEVLKTIDPDCEEIKTPGKHKYVMPLDRQMRRKMLKISKPYPSSV